MLPANLERRRYIPRNTRGTVYAPGISHRKLGGLYPLEFSRREWNAAGAMRVAELWTEDVIAGYRQSLKKDYSTRWIDPDGNAHYFHGLAKITFLPDDTNMDAAFSFTILSGKGEIVIKMPDVEPKDICCGFLNTRY